MHYIPKDKESLHSISTLSSPRTGRILAYWLVGIFSLAFVVMFLPWQQNITGEGRVTAFKPGDRPQTVESAIGGRIQDWHIYEGQFVTKGDTILELEEIKSEYFDPQLVSRTERQVEAKRQSIEAYKDKIDSYQAQLRAIREARELKLEQAKNKLEQARLKLQIDSAELEAKETAQEIALAQFDRIEDLYDKGLYSKTKLEERRNKMQKAQAEYVEKRQKLSVSQNELINARLNITTTRAEYMEKESKALTDLNEAYSGLADAEAKLAELESKLTNMEIRANQYIIRAPQTGYVVKALKSGIGETIKEGEAVATIMPSDPQIAVELFIKAMDVPLITRGREARIEFDGWPALQFSGWPSVAVGTFGGVVRVIDYVDTKGKYRILITEDPEEPWPSQLRQGSGAFGWIMLDNVPVWYEIWRQLNGFPPTLEEEPGEDKEEKIGPDKKPKAPKIKL